MSQSQEKHRRMELRRGIGNRQWGAGVPSSSEGGVSRITYACFSCRIAQKKGRSCKEIEVCSRCGGPLYKMGWSFKTPKRTDIEQWKKVQLLFASGFRFFGSGLPDGEAELPRTFAEAKEFVRVHQQHYLRVADEISELMV